MNISISAPIRKIIAGAVLTACILATAAAPAHAGMPDTAVDAKAAADLKQVRPGWWQTNRRIYFDIPARVLFEFHGDRAAAEKMAATVWTEFERIGRIFNPYAPDSEIARLNSADSKGPHKVSDDIWRVLKVSETLFAASKGAFDPTMLPVKRLWQNAVEKQEVPTSRVIQGTLSRVGFEKVRLLADQQAVAFERKGMQFDFGGIAKGYAVDRVVALLKKRGVSAGLVQLGGEVAAFGENNGAAWRIGIQDPLDMAGIWGIVSDRSDIRVSTSGNYRQPLVIAGHSFYHIFSPRTGLPVSEKILGVTTADFSGEASNALLDSAATAITVLGAEAGIRMAQKLGIEALILKETEETPLEIMTDGFRKNYEPHPN